MARKCNKCGVDLVVGENITKSYYNNGDYKCKPCINQRTYNWIKNNPEAKSKISKRYYYKNQDKFKQYYTDNIDHRLANMKRNYQDNKERYIDRQQELNSSINPGVYAIYEDNKLIYIGESDKPYRRRGEHFSIAGKQGGTKAKSVIARALGNGELQLDKLRFKMLEFIDDKQLRLDRELALQQQYKPVYV